MNKKIKTMVTVIVFILAGIISVNIAGAEKDLSTVELINIQHKLYEENTFIQFFPPGPVRQPAEFEPMEGVLVRYPFGISYQIIAEMSEDVEVVTIVSSQSQADSVESQYASNGVNIDHTSYLIAPSDSYWTRDYGPWFIFDGNDELAVVDFEYNRPRPNDNDIPSAFASDQGLPLYTMDLEHTGGNYMTDGYGISVSTDLVYSENSDKTPSQINQIMEDYLGIETYHVVDDALGEYIEHIDCWAKYLTPDTIMIIEVSPSHSNYDEIESAVDYFESQTSCYGTPYNVERVYTHLSEPYINCLILNDKVLVPTTGSQWDDDAIASFEAAMPGYEVLGFSGGWASTDALHCRTKGIVDRGMLYIDHLPLYGDQNSNDGFEINAEIIAYSGEDLISTQTKVYYKVNNGGWNSVQMGYVGNDNYQAVIPSQPDGATISYYIHAEDESGRSENHPYIGGSMAHSFTSLNPNTPENPSKPSGPSEGMIEEEYSYSTLSIDPNGDQIQYGWDWNGDNNVDQWTDFYQSGEEISASHIWNDPGFYAVQVKCKDVDGFESSFSPKKAVNIKENSAPDVPSDPNPNDGAVDVSLATILTWTGGDPDDDPVTYNVYFGSGGNMEGVAENQTQEMYIPYLDYGTFYQWQIISWDSRGARTEGPIWSFTTIFENHPPETPTISGESEGKKDENHQFSISSIDSDEDQIFYYVEWGDGTILDWIGPYDSEEIILINHSWNLEDNYQIKVKAKDIHGLESDWATFDFNVCKNKYKPILRWNALIQRIIDSKPFLNFIFKLLLDLA